jgi:hypothetical protein
MEQALTPASPLIRGYREHGSQRMRLERCVIIEIGQSISDLPVEFCAIYHNLDSQAIIATASDIVQVADHWPKSGRKVVVWL